MRKWEAHGLQKAMPHSQSSAHLSTWCLPGIFLDFLTTDGFLTAGSILVFPWHFSPTSHFICNSRKKNVWRWLGVLKLALLHFSLFIRNRSQNQLVMLIKSSEKDAFALGMHSVALFKGTSETGMSWLIYFPAHLKTTAEQTGPLIFLVLDTGDLQLFSHSVAVKPWAFTPCRK